MSWASLVKKDAPAVAAEPQAAAPASSRVAIVDANVIISGLQLGHIADRFITTQDVLDEIRDKQARHFLTTLPFSLEVQEPDEESLGVVTAFARETGDLHALSRTDLRLLAVAYAMEVARHGSNHLRKHPVQASVKPKHRTGGRQLPGWGSVPNPQDWAAIDALPDSAGQGSSRIRATAQALDATAEDDTQAAQPTVGPQPTPQPPSTPAEITTAAAGNLQFPSFGDAAAADLAASGDAAQSAAAWFTSRPQLPPQNAPSAAASNTVLSGVQHFTAAPAPPPATATVSEAGDQDELDSEDESDEGEWEQAGKSRNAVRRRKRRQARYEARQALRQQQEQQAGGEPVQPAALAQPATEATAPVTVTQPATGAEEQGAAQSASAAEEEEDDGEEEAGEDEDAEDEAEGTVGGTEQDAASVQGSTAVTASGTDCGEFTLNTTSDVACVTADFPMQNVLLQMGLRLVTRDGRQVTRLSRWAVRCSACFFVTKEAGRLFCPRCGNMTMERVEVTVSPEGAEVYGVRKKHILRGTQFSLPKPKGGRAQNLILREDELLTKLKPRRKKNPAQADLDPFAPEHGTQAAWQLNEALSKEVLATTKGAAYLLAGYKHNPNERKPVASNRRRK